MDIDEAVEIVRDAMGNTQDYDTTFRTYAEAAVKVLGWRDISKEIPVIDDVVVCTDGKYRWLDKRTKYDATMKWQDHLPTHWHPIMDIPVKP